MMSRSHRQQGCTDADESGEGERGKSNYLSCQHLQSDAEALKKAKWTKKENKYREKIQKKKQTALIRVNTDKERQVKQKEKLSILVNFPSMNIS